MDTIGVKELRDNLSLILRKVEKGGIVTVHRHGKDIVELRPIGRSDVEETVLTLKRKGILEGGSGVIGNIEPVTNRKPEKPVSDIIAEDRR